MSKRSHSLAAGLWVLLAASPGLPAQGIRGRVLFEGQPAADVRVHAYSSPVGDFSGPGVAHSAPTLADGQFQVPLPPGRFSIVGKSAGSSPGFSEPGPGGMFGYYGGSPVTVPEGSSLEVNLQVVRRQPVTVVDGEGPYARVEGVVVGPKGPEASASVFCYPDTKSDFRGPDITGPQGSLLEGTGPDGHFTLDLPPGTYYLTASRRKGDAVLGPLAPGDLFGYFDGNPVRLKAGQRVLVTVQATEKLRQPGSRSAATPRITGVQGRLLDPGGKPVPGVFAFATTDPNLIGTMPAHRSLPVGPDGGYFIELPRGGTYFVGARTGFGGPPQPGQRWGLFGGTAIRPVVVGDGAVLDGIDVTVGIVE